MEQESVDTQHTSSDVGARLRPKMGWKGKGLQENEQGKMESIKANIQDVKLIAGKQGQNEFFTAEESIHRNKLEVEFEEMEELVKKREVEADREQKIQTGQRLQTEYKLAMEFKAHLSSYDHNHKKRFKEMREQQANSNHDGRQKREQLYQDKNVTRLADAQRQLHHHQSSPAAPSSLSEEESGNMLFPLSSQDQLAVLDFGLAAKPLASKAFEPSLAEDFGEEDFKLPITHRPTENLDTDNMEQASEDTQLTSSNVGFRLLQKMGWKGKGLGKDEQGMVEPIRAKTRDAKLGLGKQEQDDFYTAEENVHRKKLEVELEETEELAKKREVEAEREQKIQTEVKEIRKVFFCELCNKQYKLAMEFETHLSSYDHNHKKRFKEMREQQANRDRDERQRREQLRHEKALQRLADAQRQQQHQQPLPAAPLSLTEVEAGNMPASLPTQDQRAAFKFGFASKPLASKMSFGGVAKKSKVIAKVAAVFQDDSDGDT